ncbi:hypothetical protein FQV39_03805 [Bosea sp. F3-2]|nr:hypothetical protein FQV39_03805 [Bosea sp. F3-2]
MERRSFVFGLLALATGSAFALPAQEAEAAPRQPTLSPDQELRLPDGTPIDWSQNRWGPPGHRPPPHHNRRWHRPPRHRRRVCRTHWDRWGRPIRRCHWVWV